MKERLKELGWILLPIGLCAGALLLIPGLLTLPMVVPSFFPASKVGISGAVLYPTLICSGAIVAGYLAVTVLSVVLGLWWLGKIIRDGALANTPFLKVFFMLLMLAVMPIVVGFSMTREEDILGIATDCWKDIRLGRSGETAVYYGTLEPYGTGGMEGPRGGGKQDGFTSGWKAVVWPRQGRRAGRDFVLNGPGSLAMDFKPVKGAEYRVEYLPNTCTIVSISPADRLTNTILDENLFGRMEDGEHYPDVMAFLRDEYLRRQRPALREPVSRDPDYRVLCVKLNLDDDYWPEPWAPSHLDDYCAVVMGGRGRAPVLLALQGTGGSFRGYSLPPELLNGKAVVSELESKTFYLHDLLVEREDGGRYMARFDGADGYVIDRSWGGEHGASREKAA